MRYISLFSGIGGFEIAIHNIFPDAECIGFSEVDKFAIQVYKHHFPDHINLGDVTQITKEQIRKIVEKDGCDLLVGGFPCQNLTSLARKSIYCNSDGLEGPKSRLFYNMVQVMKWIIKFNTRKLHIVIENNASMKNEFKQMITKTLQSCFTYPVFMTKLNGAEFGVQKRGRLYWTTFSIDLSNIQCFQTWNDILLNMNDIIHLKCSDNYRTNGNQIYNKKSSYHLKLEPTTNFYKFIQYKNIDNIGKSKWQIGYHSDTNNDKSGPVVRTCGCFENTLIDRRFGRKNECIHRKMHVIEAERLFFLPDGWVSDLCTKTRSFKLLGNTVIIRVIEYILNSLLSRL